MTYHDAMSQTAADLLMIERIADQFESEWRSGSRPSVADSLEQIPVTMRATALGELVRLDVEYRRKKGESPSIAEYARQFPNSFPPPNDLPGHGGTPMEMAQDAFRVIGRYFVLSQLKKDGHGDVLLAVNPIGRLVVLKFLRSDIDQQLEVLIQSEAQVLAQLRHPRIAGILDIDRHDGRMFIAVEHIPGQTLDQYVRQKQLSPEQIATLVASVARTLSAANAKGILHLDIKPRNVIIDPAEQAHLIDFGAARVSNSLRDDTVAGGFLSGTAAFMSPEQANEAIDCVGVRSDVFGLGGLLYYLLSGSAPFAAADFQSALSKARVGSVPPLTTAVPRELRRICEQATKADPQHRQPDAVALADQLERFSSRRVLRRQAVKIGLACFGLLVLSLVLWQSLRPPSAPASDPQLSVQVIQNNKLTRIQYFRAMTLEMTIRIDATIPEHTYAALYSLDGAGQISKLSSVDASTANRSLGYPPASLKQNAGNWTLICLTSKTGPVCEDDLTSLLQTAPVDTPLLPGLVVETSSVAIDYPRAGARPLELVPDPSADAPTRRFLEHLRAGLLSRGYGLRAVTFHVSK